MALLGGLFGNKIGYGSQPGGVAGGYGGMLNGGYNTSPMGSISDLLTGLGVGLLSQQPSSTPISPFAGIGQGLQYANQLGQQRRATGQQQFQNQLLSQDADRQAQEFELAKQKGTREQQQYDQQQSRLQAYADTITDPQAKAAFMADPEAYIKNAMPAPTDVMKNYRASGGDAKWGDISRYQKFLAQAGTNNTTVNMPPLENSFQKALGESEGGEINSISSGANSSRATADQLATIEALRGALQNAGTDVSALAPIKMQIGQLAQAVGASPDQLPGWADGSSTGMYQALDAVTKRLALGNIGSGKDGGGIPANNFTEADRNFVVAMSPQMNDTPEGFQAKVLIQKRVAQRNIDKETLWNNGSYASGPQGEPTEADYRKFKSDWSKYVSAHPLFSKDEKDNFSRLVVTGSAAAPKAQQGPAIAPAVVPSLKGPGWSQ